RCRNADGGYGAAPGQPSTASTTYFASIVLDWADELDGKAAAASEPVRVIFDTDIGPDVDDVGAAAILNALADNGEARILAMGACTSSEWGAPCLDAINTYYGRPDIPIGTIKSEG